MRGFLAGLTVCLLAALLLVLVDGVGREDSHLAASWLQDAEWACTAIWSDRWPRFRTRACGTKGQFTLDKRRCKVRTVSLGGSDWAVVASSPVRVAILTSVSIGFQGAVTPR